MAADVGVISYLEVGKFLGAAKQSLEEWLPYRPHWDEGQISVSISAVLQTLGDLACGFAAPSELCFWTRGESLSPLSD